VVFDALGYYPSKVRVREGKYNLWTVNYLLNPDGSWTVESFGHSVQAPDLNAAFALAPSVARRPWAFRGPRGSVYTEAEVMMQTNHPVPLKLRETGAKVGPVVPVPFP
jgi:hypothetical protein